MEWATLYGPDRQPNENEISQFVQSPLWAEIHSFLRKNYDVEPSFSYSVCKGQPGWNVKYQKAGRSLCTLYPMLGYFIALVVIGSKEMNEEELIMPTLCEYTRGLFEAAAFSVGGKWLMINVTDERILADVQQLIQVRRKVKGRA